MSEPQTLPVVSIALDDQPYQLYNNVDIPSSSEALPSQSQSAKNLALDDQAILKVELQREIADMSTKFQKEEKHLTQQYDTLLKKYKDLESRFANAIDETERHKKHLQDQLKSKELDITENSKQLVQLRKIMEATKSENQQKLENAKQDITKMQQKQEDLQKQLTEQCKVNENWQYFREDANVKERAHINEIEQLKTLVNSLQVENQKSVKLQEENENLKAELARTNTQYQDDKKQIQQMKHKNELLQTENRSLQTLDNKDINKVEFSQQNDKKTLAVNFTNPKPITTMVHERIRNNPILMDTSVTGNKVLGNVFIS